ncbi:MAG TPA: CdaR family protein [Draconibacterium sp.]|nr:CdaR family protein [Draconibacterium sp.]
MNKNFTDISDYVKVVKLRNNRRIVVFLICLAIATALWFLNALGKDYTTTVSYPVKFTNPPENQFLANNTPVKLDLKIDGQGFTLLRYKLLSFSPIVLDIEQVTKNLESNSGTYKVLSKNLIREVSDQLSSEVRITEISPELLEIVLDSLITKTVPVELDINVDFVPQVNLKSQIATMPDKVKITGPAISLEKISAVKTKVNILNKLDASIQQEIDLIHPERTTISPEKVTLIIEVEKYTEKELKIPIEILNKPDKVRIKLFPSEVKVLFTVGLSRFEKIKPSDFEASVDYNSIVTDMNYLNITLNKKPEFIQGIRFNPEKVEFLIERN